jgi:hypothetical protein
MSDWDECLNRTAMSVPETEPGQQQLYTIYLLAGYVVALLRYNFLPTCQNNFMLCQFI